MELRFPSQKSIEISFKVSIAGTSALPQAVSIVLTNGETALSFTAQKRDDTWVAVVERPGMIFGDGIIQVAVHVVVNSRLFIPVKTTAEIFSDRLNNSAALQPEPEVVDLITTKQKIEPKDEPDAVAVTKQYDELTQTLPVKSIESILKTLESANMPVSKIAKDKQHKTTTHKVTKQTSLQAKQVQEDIKPNNLLKSIEPQIERTTEKVIETQKPTVPRTPCVFEIKRSKIVII
jgi:hypothetical protein